MTASERLRALDGAMTPGRWAIQSDATLEDDAERVSALRNALPLIVDVVEAAEEALDPEWDASELRSLLRPPLTVLTEHLEGGDVT